MRGPLVPTPGGRRRAAAVAACLGLALGTWAAAGPTAAAPSPSGRRAAESSSATWYAPYVDATLPPEYRAADRAVNPAGQSVLGFVVAATRRSCVASWGDYYSLSSVDTSPLHLGSLVSAMAAEGETPIVSFGGEANQPLADACTSTSSLAAAYAQVVAAYHLRVVDLDIEGAAQGDTAGLARQAAALRAVQAAAGAKGAPLGVWLTLPVATTGMLPVAEQVVNTMLDGGVALSGVNLMTMYFSPSPGDGAPMLAAVESSLTAAHAQLATIFASHGVALGAAGVWAHMGATVQIGQAGIADQAFTVADAQGLVGFAEAHGLGRVSDWSANQDTPCGSPSAPTVGGYSNYCSGVVQTPGQFGAVFAQLTGSATATTLVRSATVSTATPPGSTTTPTTTTGSGAGGGGPGSSGPPAGSGGAPPQVGVTGGSFPAWSPLVPYPAGYKVDRAASVYQAKWWNQGIDPSHDAAAPWGVPWRLVGEKGSAGPPWTPRKLPPGTDPAWSPSTVYVVGDRVLYGGVPYEAKWWNEGSSPGDEATSPSASPWKPLFAVPGEPGT